MQRAQAVGEVRRVERDGQRVTREGDGKILFGAAHIVGAGRQPQHVVGEFHSHLRAAVGHQRDTLDRLGQFGDADGRNRGVLGGQQLTEFRELGIEQPGGAALTIAADTEQPLLADGRSGAQRQVDVRAVGAGFRGFCQRLGRYQHGGLDIGGFRRPGQLAHCKPEPVGGRQNHLLAGNLDADAGQHRQRVIAAGGNGNLTDGLGEQLRGDDTRLVGQSRQRRVILDRHGRERETGAAAGQ
jgi:hypothetical protein